MLSGSHTKRLDRIPKEVASPQSLTARQASSIGYPMTPDVVTLTSAVGKQLAMFKPRGLRRSMCSRPSL